MSNDELNAQIVEAKKMLFELRMKQSTRKEYKGHHFGILKTKIAQIRTVKREREVTEVSTSAIAARLATGRRQHYL